MRAFVLLCFLVACGHARSKDAVTPAIQDQLAALDDGADKLHLDRTPAVYRLIELGEPALVPLCDHLDHADRLHRMRAQRAVEGITRRGFGFDGNAWPDGASDRWTAWWASIGYDSGSDATARAGAIERLRAWSRARVP
jgi:hypothetical protein